MSVLLGCPQSSVVPQDFPCASLHRVWRDLISPYVCCHSDWRRPAEDAPATDPSVSFRFCWQSVVAGNEVRRNKCSTSIERDHENDIQQESTDPGRGLRPGAWLRIGRRAGAEPHIE